MRLTWRSERAEGVFAAGIVLAVLGVLYFTNLGSWLVNDDEGSFLYQVWRIAEGEHAYQDFLSSRDPLFLLTGAVWMRLWGVSIIPMRALATGLTLVTAFLVYLLAVRLASPFIALTSMSAFLLHPQILEYGRLFQPEPFFLLFAVLGMLLLTSGLVDDRPLLIVLAGVSYAIATLYKLLAVLSFGGCVLYLVVHSVQAERGWRLALLHNLSFILAYLLVFGIVFSGFYIYVPGFAEGVVDVNLAQGRELALGEQLTGGAAFFLVYIMHYLPLLLSAIPALCDAWSTRRQLVTCQLPTALGFLILSRALFPRLLYYLVPSLVISMAISATALLRLDRGHLYHFLFIGMVVGPWLLTDANLISRSETDTRAVAAYIASQTQPEDLVLSDYQELNFYAQRASTYHGAEISYVIVDGGSITADILIDQMEAQSVKLAVIDVSPTTGHQLVKLDDYEALLDYLGEHYELVKTLDRSGQLLNIYRRSETLAKE